MIAESSPLHLELFKENQEAVFFKDKEDLLEKVKYYMSLKDEVQRIAQNGYDRCMTSGYDHQARMESVVQKIMEA